MVRIRNTQRKGTIMEFTAPASGGGDSFPPADAEGHLLVVEPLEHVASITTSFGEKDAIRVTVHDVTTQTTHENVLWFPGALVGSLKARVGQKVLGVMGRGTAKAGQSAPWVLHDASTSTEAVAAATAYLTGQVAATIAAPAAAPAAPSALDAALGNLAGITK